MSSTEVIKPNSTSAFKEALRAHLFPDQQGGKQHTYAVLDGASVPDLLGHLYDDPRPEFVCLYRGDLKPDIAEVAPYLVKLNAKSSFTDWILTEAWGNHWGIFAISPADMTAMRKHFRTFLFVKNPEGKQVYFRYYDPRVLRIYLPACNAREVEFVFGPATSYLLEGDNQAILQRYTRDHGSLDIEKIPLQLNTNIDEELS